MGFEAGRMLLYGAHLVWLGLAVAVTGLRPAGTDRTTPLKVWLLTTAAAVTVEVALFFSSRSPDDLVDGIALRSAAELTLAVGVLGMMVCALLPPDALSLPRAGRREKRRGPRWLLDTFGPHVFGQLRFSVAFSVLFGLALSLSTLLLPFTNFDVPGRACAVPQQLAAYAGLAGFYALAQSFLRFRDGTAAGTQRLWGVGIGVVLFHVAVRIAHNVFASQYSDELFWPDLFTLWAPTVVAHSDGPAPIATIAAVVLGYAALSAVLLVRLRRLVAAETRRVNG